MAQQLVLNVENPSVMRTLRSLVKCMQGVSIVSQRKKVEVKVEDAEEEIPDLAKEEILADIDHAFKDLKLNLEGKLDFKPAEELLYEL